MSVWRTTSPLPRGNFGRPAVVVLAMRRLKMEGLQAAYVSSLVARGSKMPSRLRIVYISQSNQRNHRDGIRRGDRTKNAVVKFYGKRALVAVEEDVRDNWGGDSSNVMALLGAPSYRRSTIWSKFSRIQRAGMLLGSVYIARESRTLKGQRSGFQRFMRQRGFFRARKAVNRNTRGLAAALAEIRRAAEVDEFGSVEIVPHAGPEPGIPRANQPRIGIWN